MNEDTCDSPLLAEPVSSEEEVPKQDAIFRWSPSFTHLVKLHFNISITRFNLPTHPTILTNSRPNTMEIPKAPDPAALGIPPKWGAKPGEYLLYPVPDSPSLEDGFISSATVTVDRRQPAHRHELVTLDIRPKEKAAEIFN